MFPTLCGYHRQYPQMVTNPNVLDFVQTTVYTDVGVRGKKLPLLHPFDRVQDQFKSDYIIVAPQVGTVNKYNSVSNTVPRTPFQLPTLLKLGTH